MSLKLYRPTPDGLEPAAADKRDWRTSLRSRRWAPAAVSNPDVKKTTPLMAVLFFGALATLTFVLLLLGYGSGFWG